MITSTRLSFSLLLPRPVFSDGIQVKMFHYYVAVLVVLWVMPSGNVGSLGNEEIIVMLDEGVFSSLLEVGECHS